MESEPNTSIFTEYRSYRFLFFSAIYFKNLKMKFLASRRLEETK